jgi:2-hydroxychromene-2-carboxylate isomerase
MKIVGNRPTTIECKNKGNYASADLARWAARYKVPFQRNPHRRNFDYATLGRGALVAIDESRGANYVDVVFRSMCAGEQDLSDAAVFADLLDQAGFDGVALRPGKSTLHGSTDRPLIQRSAACSGRQASSSAISCSSVTTGLTL